MAFLRGINVGGHKATTVQLAAAFDEELGYGVPVFVRSAAQVAKEALALATKEPLAIEGTELFWLPMSGIMDSDLDLKALERLVGPWTMRTMGTVEQFAAKL